MTNSVLGQRIVLVVDYDDFIVDLPGLVLSACRGMAQQSLVSHLDTIKQDPKMSSGYKALHRVLISEQQPNENNSKMCEAPECNGGGGATVSEFERSVLKTLPVLKPRFGAVSLIQWLVRLSANSDRDADRSADGSSRLVVRLLSSHPKMRRVHAMLFHGKKIDSFADQRENVPSRVNSVDPKDLADDGFHFFDLDGVAKGTTLSQALPREFCENPCGLDRQPLILLFTGRESFLHSASVPLIHSVESKNLTTNYTDWRDRLQWTLSATEPTADGKLCSRLPNGCEDISWQSVLPSLSNIVAASSIPPPPPIRAHYPERVFPLVDHTADLVCPERALWNRVHMFSSAVTLSGQVTEGYRRGSTQLGVPTANLKIDTFPKNNGGHLLPGVYFGKAYFIAKGDDGDDISNGASDFCPERIYGFVTSFGYNPYFQNQDISLEPHLFHKFSEDFYGRFLHLSLLGMIRCEANFPKFSHLVQSIQNDCELARSVLSELGVRVERQ